MVQSTKLRVLVEHNFHHPFNPTQVTGGTERYCFQLFTLLQSQPHLDVTFLVPADTKEEFITENVIKSSCKSKQLLKELGHAVNHVNWWKEVDAISKDFDVVITNSELSSRSYFDRKQLPPTQVHINHFAYMCSLPQMSFRYLLASQYIRNSGALVLSSGDIAAKEADRTWKRREHIIKGCYPDLYSKLGEVGFPLHDGTIDVNILPYDLQPLAEAGKKVVVVGRSHTGKRMPLAARVLKDLATRGYECELFTTPYGDQLEEVTQTLTGTPVKLLVGVPHSQIMSSLASCGFLLFLSKDETNGLVAFEAASSGCKVFHETPEPSPFLGPANSSILVKGNSPAKIADVIEKTPYPSLEERQAQKDWYLANYSDQQVLKRIMKWIIR